MCSGVNKILPYFGSGGASLISIHKYISLIQIFRNLHETQ